jgi:hypothetical protein
VPTTLQMRGEASITALGWCIFVLPKLETP